LVKKEKPARERAARALCELQGYPPDIKMEGSPMWRSFLEESDAVLIAALSDGEWAKLSAEDLD